jgi:hypothetical protein
MNSCKSAQQGVQPTSGTRRVFQAFFWLWVFSGSLAESRPAHLRLTQAVGRLPEYYGGGSMNSYERPETIFPNRIRFTFSFFIYFLLALIPALSAVWFIRGEPPDNTIFWGIAIGILVASLILYPYYAVSKDGENIRGATLWGWLWRREQIRLRDVYLPKIWRQALGKLFGIVIIHSIQGKKILTLGLSETQLAHILESAAQHQQEYRI